MCSIEEKNQKIYFSNAGDSRVFFWIKGEVKAGSIDHKSEMESEKNIYKADWLISKGRVNGNLYLTRGYGNLEYKQNKSLLSEEQIITANQNIKIENHTKEVDFIIIGYDGIETV